MPKELTYSTAKVWINASNLPELIHLQSKHKDLPILGLYNSILYKAAETLGYGLAFDINLFDEWKRVFKTSDLQIAIALHVLLSTKTFVLVTSLKSTRFIITQEDLQTGFRFQKRNAKSILIPKEFCLNNEAQTITFKEALTSQNILEDCKKISDSLIAINKAPKLLSESHLSVSESLKPTLGGINESLIRSSYTQSTLAPLYYIYIYIISNKFINNNKSAELEKNSYSSSNNNNATLLRFIRFWNKTHTETAGTSIKLRTTEDRERQLQRILNSNYSIAEIERAISNHANDPWYASNRPSNWDDVFDTTSTFDTWLNKNPKSTGLKLVKGKSDGLNQNSNPIITDKKLADSILSFVQTSRPNMRFTTVFCEQQTPQGPAYELLVPVDKTAFANWRNLNAKQKQAVNS